MRIETKLRLSFLLSLGVALLAAAGMATAFRHLQRNARRMRHTNRIVRSVFELRIMTTDYLDSRLDRAREQWNAAYESLAALLDVAETETENQAFLLVRMRTRHETLGRAFANVEAAIGPNSPNASRDAAEALIARRFTTQTDVHLLAMISHANQFMNAIYAETAADQRRAALLVALSTGLLLALIFVTAIILQRSAVRPLHRLQRVAEVIGRGNLEHRTGIDRKDEVGDLARAFDRMTAQLSETTASRDDLTREMAERKKAEIGLARYTDALRERNEQLAADLDMARDVQRALLPHHYPSFPPGAETADSAFRFASLYLPCETLGGDFFSVAAVAPGAAGVFLCDVMGHGTQAALVTAIVRGLMQELQSVADAPGPMLTEMNRGLIEILKSPNQVIFASAVYLVADAASGRLSCASAGHPSPLHLRRRAGRVQRLLSGEDFHRPALGIEPGCEYPECRTVLAPGDALVLFTDGLYEMRNTQEDAYGRERLEQAVEARVRDDPAEIFRELVNEVRMFCGDREFDDDVCLVSLELTHLL